MAPLVTRLIMIFALVVGFGFYFHMKKDQLSTNRR